MHQKITCKLKYSEKDISRQFYPKHLPITGKSIQFAAKAVLMTRQKNLMIFNVINFPSNLNCTVPGYPNKYLEAKFKASILIHKRDSMP